MKCRKCGNEVEIVDIEYLANRKRRYTVYCFECDKEYNILVK